MTTAIAFVVLALFYLLLIFFWALNFIGMPGNWFILVASAIWILFGPVRFGFSWWVVLGMLILAIIGEVIELVASLVGTNKMGGSRRGATLSVAGSIVGAFLGMLVGLPIPIPLVGSLMGALLFASLGAMAGAMIGEYTLGTNWGKNTKIGIAAFVGRMLGTFGKIIMGAAILAIAAVAPFF